MARATPACPPAPSPYMYDRPTMQERAPSASARIMSAPVRTPLVEHHLDLGADRIDDARQRARSPTARRRAGGRRDWTR